ncbi:hypothetical protein OVS_04185 [Mycoplasma ovis str. Michigan]|uniref:Uncharacterized protein n=1 Tax=Mycoplasma ovis str. Michigan TaxID=1415773 RepID=A0ABM5P2C5_9MOLU|nr:hypothetical protein [Mycoplasma ovis]AHC40564.1 hypothetical protein OVS_04185 [Mycoplasma ovis str. Michigan]
MLLAHKLLILGGGIFATSAVSTAVVLTRPSSSVTAQTSIDNAGVTVSSEGSVRVVANVSNLEVSQQPTTQKESPSPVVEETSKAEEQKDQPLTPQQPALTASLAVSTISSGSDTGVEGEATNKGLEISGVKTDSTQSHSSGRTLSHSSPAPIVKRVEEGPKLGISRQPAQVTSTSTTQQLSIDALEAVKYKERTENPDLCRNILTSTKDSSSVKACRVSKDSIDLEFMYYQPQIGEMPIRIKDMRFTHSSLVINLTKSDYWGMNNHWMDISQATDMFTGKGLMNPSDMGTQSFTDKQCQLEITGGTGTQKIWKITKKAGV